MKLSKLQFDELRAANVSRCDEWHPGGLESWSTSDWMTAVCGEVGELAGVIKMMNRERDHLRGNKFTPTPQHAADEMADVVIYLDLLAAAMGIDLGRAVAEKYNRTSEAQGFRHRLPR